MGLSVVVGIVFGCGSGVGNGEFSFRLILSFDQPFVLRLIFYFIVGVGVSSTLNCAIYRD